MGSVTNVKVRPMELTWGGSALGLTEGDLELTLSENTTEITAHQEGTNVLSDIRTGKSVELSVQLKEIVGPTFNYILSQSGSTVTASGASSAVIAWGGAKDFTHVLTEAKELKMRPVNAASGDFSGDITAWLAYPIPESLSFSGENPSLLSVTFKVYPDHSKAKAARLLVFGSTAGNFTQVS
jgi:hypothetical protein